MDLQSNLILTLLIMFSVLYVFFNMKSLRNGNLFNDESDYKKPLIIALIVTLLYYLYATWDKKEEEIYSYSIANNRLGVNNSNRMNCPCNYSDDDSLIFLAPSHNKTFGIGY